MTLSPEDRIYLILGIVGEFCSMIEEDDDDDVEGFFNDVCKMSDSELIEESETSLTPQEFYHLWSNYVPDGCKLELH